MSSVVCLSVVCHIHVHCLNSFTDFDTIWEVHLCGPATHCVRWGPWPPAEGEIWGVKLPAKNMQLQIPAATW